MKDRIMTFLQNENKSYAQFADDIGVQPSGISHILSGRNNPSLDFVIKMLHRFPALSSEWLLFGRGPMYKHKNQPSLFDITEVTPDNITSGIEASPAPSDELPPEREGNGYEYPDDASEVLKTADMTRRLVKVILFYSDKSFIEYLPS